MFNTLLKKQLLENFKGFFLNSKTNTKRSNNNTIKLFVLFSFLMVGVIGGTATSLSILFCKPMVEVDLAWLYFLITSGIAILFGVFGSIFSTYSTLYLSKDNSLLLSMPIPIKYIVASRLLNVYIMGTMFSGLAILPSVIVYWAVAGLTFQNFICNIFLMIIITFFVLILSCLLGFVVAKISSKVKNKSFISVLISLFIIGLYYFCYFKAQELVENLFENLTFYGESIKGAVYGLYKFGCIGEGDILSTIIFTLAIIILSILTFILLKNTFLKIAISNGKIKAKNKTKKNLKQKSVFLTLLSKEFNKFISSPNYMINCGLGIILIPIFAILILVKGNVWFSSLENLLSGFEGVPAILICSILITLNSINNIATPSISLEGKNLWILKSLPINSKKILYSKFTMHLLLSAIPLFFALICSMIILQASLGIKIAICVLVIVYTIFSALFALFLGIKMPILSWTNEIVPIKQSGAVSVFLLGGWGIAAVFTIVYFLLAYKIGVIPYLSICTIVFLIISIVLIRFINTKGKKIFENL